MDAVTATNTRATNNTRTPRRRRTSPLPALLAGGACGLAGTPAAAVQLGDIQVQSALGHPLRASIAYALNPGEQLYSYCIYLRPSGADGLPALERARLTLANGRIHIEGSVAVREPMISIGVTLDCPYSANLTRAYTVMLDPAPLLDTVPAAPLTAGAIDTANRPIANRPIADRPVEPARRPATAVRPAQPSGAAAAVPATGTYRVRAGDTLSAIASRIDNRPVGLWAAVDALFAANPHAFIGGDPNRLKAGSVLTIPAFDGTAIPAVADAPQTVQAPTETAAASETTAYPGFDGEAADTAAPGETDAAATTATVETAEPATSATTAVDDQTPDLRPGDVMLGDDRSFVSPIESPVESPVESPAAAADSLPEVLEPRAPGSGLAPASGNAPQASGDAASADGWQNWIGGGVIATIALLLGLLLGRMQRGRVGAPDAEPPATAVDDAPAAQSPAAPDVDFDIGTQPATSHAVALDADLSQGTGLKAASELEVAQDFGFSTAHELGANIDLLIPAGGTADDDASPTTDILPTRRVEEHTILEREILPTDDDDYDLSMIVDATKQKFEDSDVTAKDLVAVEVPNESIDDSDEEYTLSKEIDYKVLEHGVLQQDHEDELKATQALNAEIVKAATELAGRLDDYAELPAGGDTVELDNADVLAAGDSDETEVLTDLDDTGVNPAVPADVDGPTILTDLDDTGINPEVTAEMPGSVTDDASESTFEGTVEMPGADRDGYDELAETTATTELTEKLPAAENDPTVEMDVESGVYSTRKSAG